MSILYHVTTEQNAVSILAHGLTPTIGPRSAAMNERLPAIYFFSAKEALEDAMSNWMGESFDEQERLVILEIYADDLVVESSPAGYECLCFHPVASDRIRASWSEDEWGEFFEVPSTRERQNHEQF